MGVAFQFRVVTAKLGLCPTLWDSVAFPLPLTNMQGMLINPHSLGVFYGVCLFVGHPLFARS